MTRPQTENGVQLEDTDPGVRAAVLGAADEIDLTPTRDGRSHARELAEEFLKLAGGGGGGMPPDAAKRLKRHNWIFAAVIALFGSGGVVASYYATEARSRDNATEIERHEAEPMHSEAAKRVGAIEQGLGAVQSDIGEIKDEQIAIGQGIEQLKKEAQTDKQRRLEEQLEDLKRENRRLSRERRGQ